MTDPEHKARKIMDQIRMSIQAADGAEDQVKIIASALRQARLDAIEECAKEADASGHPLSIRTAIAALCGRPKG